MASYMTKQIANTTSTEVDAINKTLIIVVGKGIKDTKRYKLCNLQH